MCVRPPQVIDFIACHPRNFHGSCLPLLIMKKYITINTHNLWNLFIISFFFLLSILLDTYWIYVILSTLTFLVVFKYAENDSITHLMFLMGFTIFIYAPAVINGFFFNTSFVLFFVSSIAAVFFLFSTKNLKIINLDYDPRRYRPYFLVYSFVLILASFSAVAVIFFVGPVVMFYGLCLSEGRRKSDYYISLIFLLTFVIYYMYGWDGFGRTVVFGYLFTALLCYLVKKKIKINKFLLVLFGFLGSLLAVSRKGSFSGISIHESLDDSAISPYRLAVTFIDKFNIRGYDFYGLFDQIIFSLFSFIPRELWPSKPFGFGFQYVVENMGGSLVDAGHSVASTLIADHFYYIGPLGFLTAIITLWFIALILKLSYKASIFHGHLHLIFASNMMVLVWGGATSFSARVVSPMVSVAPIIIFYLLSSKILKR